MSTSKKEITVAPSPRKIRGAQPGNRNARPHGFNSRELTPEQQEALVAAHQVQDLDQEIALLRLKILAIANNLTENYPAFLMALSLLTKTITVDMQFKGMAAAKDRYRLNAEAALKAKLDKAAETAESYGPLLEQFSQMRQEDLEEDAKRTGKPVKVDVKWP